MPKPKYDVLTRNGKDRFLLIPEKDYQTLLDRLEDERDLRDLESAKRRNAGKPAYTLAQVKRELGMARPKRKSKG